MNYTLPSEVQDILNKFQKAGFQIYIVGGAVRDLLMGRAGRRIKDWDFTTDATPEEILKLLPEGFYDNQFGTVGINSPLGIMEITTMRKEGKYEDFRHPDKLNWTNKIEEDLARRDFTINAIALRLASLAQGKPSYEIIDPFNGQDDIQSGIIKTVGDPSKRFQEDALRLIRAIRFSVQLNFEINQHTFTAIQKNANLILKISWERIRDELFKILASDTPYLGIVKLREGALLQIILPELERCFGIVQEGPKHERVYDIGKHCLLSLKHVPSTDPLVRLATLLHDVGKPDTVKTAEDGNVTFYQHDVVGGKIVQKIAKRFNLSKKQTDKLYRLVRWHLFTVDENQTDSAIRRFIQNVEVENVDDMMAVRVGDRLGGGTEKAISWRMEKYQEKIKEVLKKPFSISDLKVNGNDVMETLDIKPGPKVREILEKLFQEVLKDSSKNNKQHLLEKIKSMA